MRGRVGGGWGVFMVFQSSEITRALNARKHARLVDDDVGNCLERGADVAFVLFLEPRQHDDPRWSTGERCLNWLVRHCQPSPALMHCELLLPPLPSSESDRTQFATYLGRTASWMGDKRSNFDFYLGSSHATWRAVPVFGIDAAARIRSEADVEQGVAYSLARYVTATPPFRFFARYMPSSRRAPAHCATLTARILRNAMTNSTAPSKPAAWYGPSTLYHEVCRIAAQTATRMGLESRELDGDVATCVETLLRAPMTSASVASIGDDGAADAVHALVARVCTDLVGGDAAAQRISQRQLAHALLRWVILREKEGEPAYDR